MYVSKNAIIIAGGNAIITAAHFKIEGEPLECDMIIEQII